MIKCFDCPFYYANPDHMSIQYCHYQEYANVYGDTYAPCEMDDKYEDEIYDDEYYHNNNN